MCIIHITTSIGTIRQIPREDVADVCINSLLHKGAAKRSFDITAKSLDPDGALSATTNWNLFFSANKGNCAY